VIGSDGSRHTRENHWGDVYRSGFSHTSVCMSRLRIGLEPSQSSFAMQTWTVGRLPEPSANTCNILRFGYSDVARLDFSTGRLLELVLLNRWLCMTAHGLQMVCYATQCVDNIIAPSSYWQIVEKYWNIAIEENNIQSISFEACTLKLLNEVC
jgi:hypothetical protein